jgi:hypothetical protein
MWVEQAIFTSLTRLGKAGYHVVARSSGISEADATALAAWSPSHGALLSDAANRASISFHPMPGGRFALSRTCEGPPEYSGRGGRQLYTHTLVFDGAMLRQARHKPFALYRDALALGHLHYRAEPDPILRPVRLSATYPRRDVDAPADLAPADDVPYLEMLASRLSSGQDVTVPYLGDRAAMAERLLAQLPPELIPQVSFATSLRPSVVRPFRLTLVNAPERR